MTLTLTVSVVAPGPGAGARSSTGAPRAVIGRSVVDNSTEDTFAARAAFEAFFRAHHQGLSRLAFSLTGDHAEADDVAADALVETWRNWERVTAADHPLAYVRRIVVNRAADRLRTKGRDRRGLRLLGPLGSLIHTPDPGTALDLHAAILRLPPRRRACVVLRYVHDLPFAQVAETLGITEGAAKSQVSKGLVQLRQWLDTPDGSPRDLWQEVPE